MGVLLQIIGGIVLLVFVAIGLGLLFLWLKLRSVIKKAKNLTDVMGGVIPKVSMQFNIIENAPWNDPKYVENATTELQNLGYVRDGDFALDGMKDCYTRGFVHRDGRSIAAIINAAKIATVIDFASNCDDGRVVSATNSPLSVSHKTPPFKTAIRMKEAKVSEVYTAFKEALDGFDGAIVPVEAGEFRSTYEAGYRREVEWQYTAGGFPFGNIEVIQNMTGAEIDPETKAFLEDNGVFGGEELRGKLIEAYLRQSDISALEWEEIEDDVIFVSENLLQEEVIQLISYQADEPEEEIRAAAKRSGASHGRDLFWSLASTFGVQGQFRKIYELQEPMVADVIVSPSND
jgi:hypothetical protein